MIKRTVILLLTLLGLVFAMVVSARSEVQFNRAPLQPVPYA